MILIVSGLGLSLVAGSRTSSSVCSVTRRCCRSRQPPSASSCGPSESSAPPDRPSRRSRPRAAWPGCSTTSPSSSLIKRTPCVFRPIVRVVLDAGADDHAAAGGEHDLVVLGHLADGDDRPVSLAGLNVDQTFPTAVLGAVFRQQRAFAVTVGADRQQAGGVVVAVGDHHADDQVAFRQARCP